MIPDWIIAIVKMVGLIAALVGVVTLIFILQWQCYGAQKRGKKGTVRKWPNTSA